MPEIAPEPPPLPLASAPRTMSRRDRLLKSTDSNPPFTPRAPSSSQGRRMPSTRVSTRSWSRPRILMLLVRRLKLTPGSTRLPKSLQLRTCNSSRRLRSVLLCQAGAGRLPSPSTRTGSRFVTPACGTVRKCRRCARAQPGRAGRRAKPSDTGRNRSGRRCRARPARRHRTTSRRRRRRTQRLCQRPRRDAVTGRAGLNRLRLRGARYPPARPTGPAPRARPGINRLGGAARRRRPATVRAARTAVEGVGHDRPFDPAGSDLRACTGIHLPLPSMTLEHDESDNMALTFCNNGDSGRRDAPRS